MAAHQSGGPVHMLYYHAGVRNDDTHYHLGELNLRVDNDNLSARPGILTAEYISDCTAQPLIACV